MIIRTRYRDIPVEEVRKCAPGYRSEEWERHRGQPVELLSGTGGRGEYPLCQQPAYWNAAHTFWACPHMAEIGD